MLDTLSPVFEWMNAHPHLSGLVTFIISAAESVAIIGTIVPGSVMMTAIGTLAGADVIPLWPTIIWAILGAIVGDGISYWIGHYFKDRLHQVWPFKNHPQILQRGDAFFHKHGGMSVFIGRFVGPVRAIVPLVAGMLGMKPLRFTIANVSSAIGWAPAYMLPGIILGAASLELPPDIAVHFILFIFLFILFTMLCIWVIHKLFKLIGNKIDQMLNWIWNHLRNSRYFHIITLALKHHKPSKTHGQLVLAFYFCLVSFLFLYLSLYVMMHGSQNIALNSAFLYLFRSLRSTTSDTVMIYITFLGDRKVLLPLVLTLFFYLGWKKRWHSAGHVLALGVFTAGGIFVIKHIVQSFRPVGILHSPATFSFPSGHTTLATTFYFGIALLLVQAWRIKRSWFIYSVAILLAFIVGISRLYLGAHWLTDVLGSWLLSSALLIFISISYNRKSELPLNAKGILLTVFLTLSVTYGYAYFTRFEQLKLDYTLIPLPNVIISADDWWHQKNPPFPLFRMGRIGHPAELLTLQWLDNLSTIKQTLLKQGWESPPERDWISIFKRVADIQSTEHIPLLPAPYLDKNPALILIKHVNGDKKLVILRIWESNIFIKEAQQKLWVGSVTIVPRTYSWLFPRKKSSEIGPSTAILFNHTPKQFKIKQIAPQPTELILKRHLENEKVILIGK